MKRIIFMVCLSLIFFVSAGLAGDNETGKKADYSAHFTDMDADNDDAVTWDEFKAQYAHAPKSVFEEADADKNGKIDHDELHEFKEKHGHGCQDEKKVKE